MGALCLPVSDTTYACRQVQHCPHSARDGPHTEARRLGASAGVHSNGTSDSSLGQISSLADTNLRN